jgi:phenylalanyl-tRNA synthetase beta subunit
LDHSYLNQLLNKDSNIQVFEIEEILRTELKTKKKDRIFYIEIAIDKIPKHVLKKAESGLDQINFIKYQTISEFPSSTRDFSFSIKDFKQYDAVITHLSNLNDKNLRDSFIFDFYENKKLNEIKIGIRLIFQSNKETLSDDEIQHSVNRLLKPIIDLDGVSVPGLN